MTGLREPLAAVRRIQAALYEERRRSDGGEVGLDEMHAAISERKDVIWVAVQGAHDAVARLRSALDAPPAALRSAEELFSDTLAWYDSQQSAMAAELNALRAASASAEPWVARPAGRARQALGPAARLFSRFFCGGKSYIAAVELQRGIEGMHAILLDVRYDTEDRETRRAFLRRAVEANEPHRLSRVQAEFLKTLRRFARATAGDGACDPALDGYIPDLPRMNAAAAGVASLLGAQPPPQSEAVRRALFPSADIATHAAVCFSLWRRGGAASAAAAPVAAYTWENSASLEAAAVQADHNIKELERMRVRYSDLHVMLSEECEALFGSLSGMARATGAHAEAQKLLRGAIELNDMYRARANAVSEAVGRAHAGGPEQRSAVLKSLASRKSRLSVAFRAATAAGFGAAAHPAEVLEIADDAERLHLGGRFYAGPGPIGLIRGLAAGAGHTGGGLLTRRFGLVGTVDAAQYLEYQVTGFQDASTFFEKTLVVAGALSAASSRIRSRLCLWGEGIDVPMPMHFRLFIMDDILREWELDPSKVSWLRSAAVKFLRGNVRDVTVKAVLRHNPVAIKEELGAAFADLAEQLHAAYGEQARVHEAYARELEAAPPKVQRYEPYKPSARERSKPASAHETLARTISTAGLGEMRRALTFLL